MRRRDFVAGLGAAALPVSARGQQAMPVVGLLRSTTAGPFADLVAALRQGLRDEGYEEGRNLIIEQRWADNLLDRLPALAAELVQRRASVIVGNQTAIEAVKA